MIRENFNRDWQFLKGWSNAATAAFMGTDEVHTVHLPHDAMIHEERRPDVESGAQTGFYPGGEYIYQKSLTAPEEWKEKTVWLEFEGVYQTAMVYINGALADIYADAEEVELFLNGRSLGRKPAGEEHNFSATYELTYEPGELTAVSYTGGKETGRFSLQTAGEKIYLCAEADRTVLSADGEDLSFVTIKLTDGKGTENLFTSKKVTVSVEGAGRLEGFGSANPQSPGSYDDTEWETYDGYVMAVVRAGEVERTIRVIVTAEGCEEQCVELQVQKQTS